MIKAIILDMGGVILDMHLLLAKFVKIFHQKDKNSFWNKLNLFAVPMCRGEINEVEFWKKLANELNVQISESEAQELWVKDFDKLTRVNKSVLRLVNLLRRKYKVILLSNTIERHVKINRERGVFNNFDLVINSCEVGMTKDNKEMFMLAINNFNLKPEECIFIDDIKKFVEMANSLGMKGILYKNSKQLKNELRQFGVL